MGEVYRARDTKLNRDVALKVLPDSFVHDSERVARFRREAQVLASLNHPHVGGIYGLEDANGVTALVLELVEGPTLADRIAQGPLRIDEAQAIARHIVEALEAAHEQGIIHRDLKPANIKVRADGTVKVLDFGLAKTMEPAAGTSSMSESPTITTPAMTRAGIILGTAAYMSPEQARGQAIDKRVDIWAFGCVLFEMLTGRMTFSGDTVSDTIAAILERPPDWSRLPAATPPNLRLVLERCLQKDPKRRWRDIGDVGIEFDDGQRIPQASVREGSTNSRRWERAAWTAAVLLVAGAATLLTSTFRKAPVPPEMRFELSFPRDIAADFAQIAISPDGQQLVASPAFGRNTALWLRPIASTSGTTLPGTEGAAFPFWSPDGASIGFFADGKLKRVDVDSRAIQILADAPTARGGAWQSDGMILYAPSAAGPLSRVPATGGQPVAATHLETGQNDHRSPFILPDGQHFLYYARGTPQVRGVHVARLDGSESKRLLDADAAAVYATSGHLLFVRQGDLFAQPFDATRLTLAGAPFRVAGGISINPGISLASLSASLSGAVAYGTGSIRRTQLVWFDRTGKRSGTVGPPDLTTVANPSLSPDGLQVALSRVVAGNWDIWMIDLQGVMSRFTTDLVLDFSPVWSPNGRQLFFESANSSIHSRSVNEGETEQVVLQRPEMMYPNDVSPDGTTLLYTRASTAPTDLWYMSLAGDRTPRPFAQTPSDERDGQFSADGKWVAFQSNQSGHFEIYLQPFPGPGDRIPVSAGGGQQVRWAHHGTELFFIGPDQTLSSVAITFAANGAVTVGKPGALFRIGFENNFQARQQYMVSPDDQRFLVNTPTDAVDPPSISWILNWKGQP